MLKNNYKNNGTTYLTVFVHHDTGMLRRYQIVPDSHIAVNIAAGGHMRAAGDARIQSLPQ